MQPLMNKLTRDKYRKTMTETFKLFYKRVPIDDQELMFFSFASFLANNKTLDELCVAAAGVANLLLPEEDLDKFTMHSALTVLREALTQMLVISDLKLTERRAAGEVIDTLEPIVKPLKPGSLN